jgi:hypothetical protein
MSSSLQELDSHGHQLGCPEFGNVPMADPAATHVDLFCDCTPGKNRKSWETGLTLPGPQDGTSPKREPGEKRTALLLASTIDRSTAFRLGTNFGTQLLAVRQFGSPPSDTRKARRTMPLSAGLFVTRSLQRSAHGGILSFSKA